MTERAHPDEPDLDAVFESIVARWDDEAPERPQRVTDEPTGTPDLPPSPPHRQSTGDVRGALPARPVPPRDEPDEAAVPWRVDPTHSVADALLGADDDPGESDDEGWVPPSPAPLPPVTDRLFWGALLGLGLGILGVLWLAVTRADVGGWASFLVLVLIVGGLVCLFLRQPRDRDDDPSNGARV